MTGEGLPALLAELNNRIRPEREFMELSVPHERRGDRAVARGGTSDRARLRGRESQVQGAHSPHLHEEFAPFIVQELQTD